MMGDCNPRKEEKMNIIIELQHEHYRGYKIINYSPGCFMIYWGESYQAIWEDESYNRCKNWIDGRETKIDYNRNNIVTK